MWPLILGLWLIALALVYNARRGPKNPLVARDTRCLECEGATRVHRIQHSGRRSGYDLTECTECGHTTTYVHGMVSRLVYCPDCSQRTLEVREIESQHAHADGPRRLEESCHLCGYARTGHLLRIAGAKSRRKRGIVLRFPNGKRDLKD